MIERCLKTFLAAVALALAPPVLAVAQDRPTGCVIESWPAFMDSGPQKHWLRETLKTDAGDIFAVEFGPPAGEYAKLYLFMLTRDGCEREVMLVGTFNYLTDIAHQNGELGPNERRYHIDLLRPETHNVLGFRTSPPGYDEMREMALSVLK